MDIIRDVRSEQLDNTRDILVYLPPAYHESTEPFPVLYMHDGQNLFDPATSFAGAWGVHEAVASAEGAGPRVIVVGIPNVGPERLREYSPWDDAEHGEGLGDAYVDFVLDTVKPLVDERYRTRRDVEGTGIAGSSMGALISLYAFFRQPARFGFVGALSPALWYAEHAAFRHVEEAAFVPGRIYMDVGLAEGENAVNDARAMRDLLVDKGYREGQELRWVEDEAGEHNEAAWGRRLRDALPFLLAGDR